ncbi:CRACD-like protein [Antennarius striatus]|uniref:CRACD-like protein n=1 Tax=Antennarius striatus TaxID=241820 RepID=UPI0035AE56A1
MDSLVGDTEESAEDSQGRKKSKIKSLKSHLFRRSKRAGEEGNLSQSVSDITAGGGLGSEEDLTCSPGKMGSRAVSHDSIFLDDQVLTDAEPTRVFSQENVHSKIKTLQMKLQQQKMHLGPPPLVLPVKQQKSCSEDDGIRQAPPEISVGDTTQGAHSKAIFQPLSLSLFPILKPTPIKPVAQTALSQSTTSVISNPAVIEPPVDFSSPAQSTSCLDNSAARHRMSIKPKNQRASTKRRLDATDSKSHLETLKTIGQPATVNEEELSALEEVTLETEKGREVICSTPECPSESQENVLITTNETSISSSLALIKLDRAPPDREPSEPPQVVKVNPEIPADVISSEQQHFSIMPLSLKDQREEGSEKPLMSHDKKDTLNKAEGTQFSSNQLSTTLSSEMANKSSSVHQQIQIITESTRVIKRSVQGSGSFHFSITAAKNRSGERPQSSSFVEVLEQTEARQRPEDKSWSSMKEKAEHRDIQPTEGPIVVRAHRSSGILWDKKDNLKKEESITPKGVTISAVKLESRPEVVEQAVEAQEVGEDEGKPAFGIKLRSTSQRFRSNASSIHHPKPSGFEEQFDKQKGKEIFQNAIDLFKTPSTNISCTPSTSGHLTGTDPASSGSSVPVKHSSPLTCNPPNIQKELETTCPNPGQVDSAFATPQDPKSFPQPAPFEVSWMSLAREKTRSLQQLFTSKFPREFTSMQGATRPSAQTSNEAETLTGTQVQTQTVTIQQSKTPLEAANPPLTDAGQAEKAQSRSEGQTIKPSLMGVQQKISGTSAQSNISRETQTSKQTNESQSRPNTNPASQSASAQNNTQTETQESVTQSSAQSNLSSSKQQPPWRNQSLHPVNIVKSTPSPASVPTTSSAPAPLSGSVLRRIEGEASMQQKETSSLQPRYGLWVGSAGQRSAFLERRAEWTTPPGTKGVDMKKEQTEAPPSGEPPASAKSASQIKENKPDGRQVMNPTDTGPIKVPDRTREDKWLWKNVPSSSSPSSSPTITSALQSVSDSGQPSWMELAKRKSMAWSDKSMD